MNLFGGINHFKGICSVVLFLTVVLLPLKGYSQSKPKFPNTQRLVQGTNLQPGAVYIIDDVELSANGTPTNVDAILRIVSFTGTPTVESIDITQNVLNRFEPSITYDTSGEAVRWQMEFIVAGSADNNLNEAVRFPLDSYTLEIIDLDAQEWAEVVVPNSYELAGVGQPETIISVANGTLVPNSIRFTSADVTDPGIIVTSERSIVRINYKNVSVVDFTLGRNSNSPNQTRNISIGFLGEVVFGDPVTTTVNNPPVVQDNTGNVVDQDENFKGNLLTGANDPDGNLDPSSIVLIDPNDISNQGGVGSPLIISGVGTYTVTNTGSILFDPVSTYTGDASIFFRVEDTLGVSSDRGNLQITVLPPACNAAKTGSADRDEDGISDVCDLDNDNDGILDSVEGCAATLGLTDVTNVIIDETTWKNNYLDEVTNEVVEDFEGKSGAVSNNTFSGFTLNTGTIKGSSFGTNAFSGSKQVTVSQNNTLTINFTSPVYGFGINVGDLHDTSFGQPSTFSVAVDGTTIWNSVDVNIGSTLQVTNTVDNSTLLVGDGIYNFFGYYNVTTPISTVTVTISGSGENIVYDDISYIPACRDTDLDGVPDALDLDADNDGIADVKEVAGTDVNNDGRADGDSGATGIPFSAGVGITPVSSDGDSLANYLDIDSDNDGIPDNIEAQDTFDYIPPSGQGSAMIDADQNGLDDAYQTTGINGIFGLIPENTDNSDNPDYLDADSDNDGVNDIAENGSRPDSITSTVDTDNDGLYDIFEGTNNTDGFDVNDQIDVPNNTSLGDADSDFLANGTGGNVDYRDNPNDTDNDGILDVFDIDDDNDGILDIDEGFNPCTGGTITSSIATITADNGGFSEVQIVDLSSIGVAVGDNVTVKNVKARGDIDGANANEDFTLSFNSGEFTSSPMRTASECNTTLQVVNFNSINQTIKAIDIGNGVPGITILGQTNTGVDAICSGIALQYTVDITCTTTTPRDTDGDTVPDYVDLDADNDGIPDNIEAQSTFSYTAPTGVDSDKDGLDNAYDATPNGNANGVNSNGLSPQNTDSTDNPDYIDLDSDNDGVFDVVESGSSLANDGSGKVTGTVGSNGLVNTRDNGDDYADVNGSFDDTQTDNFTDTDGDIAFGGDVDYRDIAGVVDTDNDGVPDTTDLDDDNDGILDTVENDCTTVASGNSTNITANKDARTNRGTLNTQDNNGVELDNLNEFIVIEIANGVSVPIGTTIVIRANKSNNNDKTLQFEQSNADGTITSNAVSTGDLNDDNLFRDFNYVISGSAATHIKIELIVDNGSGRAEIDFISYPSFIVSCTNPDTDGDGIIDSLDLDSDNDGLTDVIESGGTDSDRNGKADGAVGTSGNSLGVPSSTTNGTGNTPTTTDTDSIPDYLDIDADNDGIPDNVEGQTTSGWTAPSGVGTAITDANKNGVDDNYENGTTIGLTPINTDGTDKPDYQDTDTDNDGVNDVAENGDNDTFALADADKDGLVDAFDDNNDSSSLGSTVNDNHNSPNASNLGDEDNDLGSGGDVDYRDIAGVVDSDNDGIPDTTDLDDDNDGILDTEEGCLNAEGVINNFNFGGDATTLSATEVRLTSDQQNQAGVLMSTNRINFNVDFTFNFELFFGTKNINGADGIALVFHNDPKGSDAIGTFGAGLGAQGIQNGIVVEFDTYGTDNNVSFGDPGFLSTSTDHTSIYDSDTGLIDGGGNPLTAPNYLTGNISIGNVEDGSYYKVELSWNASTNKLLYNLLNASGTIVASNTLTNDLVDNFFGGENNVFYGVTSSTGASSNLQKVRNFEISCTKDTDSDGIVDSLDLDSDNDGITDVIESGGTDSNRDGRADGAVGTTNSTNGIPSSAGLGTVPRNLDSDSIPDYLDIDADNDGIPDNVEGQPSRNYVAPSGVATAITDANKNGVDDNYETGGFVGIDPENTDGTDNPDYIDTNSDNDLKKDILENGDADNVLSGKDSDGDGLDDNFDDNNDSTISGATVNDGINPPSATNLGDEDNDFSSIGDLDYRDAGGNGVPMITQVYQFNNERWIEVTNVSKTASINPRFINVLLFKNKTGDQTGILPDASFTLENTLAPGQSVLFKNSNNTITNTHNAAVEVTNNNLTDIEGANDMIILSNFSNLTAWVNRFDVVAAFDNKTSFVRIDERLTPNATYTPAEWVVFIDDAISSFTESADANAGRHPHAPLISEIRGANTNANILLGLHRVDVTTRKGGAWNNGTPDRSRFVIVDEDFNHTSGKLSARKLTVNASRKLGITDNLLVVTNNIVLNGDIRLIDSDPVRLNKTDASTRNSSAQLIQTHESASLVTGGGKLLIDQNSTIPSVFRYDYMSSPVQENAGAATFSLVNVLKDGSNATSFNGIIGNGKNNIAKDINFKTSGFDGSYTDNNSTPITLADYWVYTFETDGTAPANWEQVRSSGNINNLDGFIFKGPGRLQNYTFAGVPKDGTFSTAIGGFESYLVGNPYPSAISVKEFIEDNIDAISGVLYFWQHAGERNAEGTAGHNFRGYTGGYATRTILTGVDAKSTSEGIKNTIYEAENSINAIKGGILEKIPNKIDKNDPVIEDTVDVITLGKSGDEIKFRGIDSSVDSLIVRYKSLNDAKLKISQLGRGTILNELLLKASADTIVVDTIPVCFVEGRPITISSIDTVKVQIDYIRLIDNDGITGCAPDTDFKDVKFKFREPGPYIAVGQGFFVVGDEDGGTIRFDNSQREYIKEQQVRNNNTLSFFFKGANKKKSISSTTTTSEIPLLKLAMNHEDKDVGSLSRQLAITFGPFQSFDYDKGYDAAMFDVGATDIYWKFKNNDSKFVIAGVESIYDEMQVPLEIKMAYQGSVAIKIDELKNLDRPIYILDKLSGESYRIDKGSATLTLNQGTHADRFFLAFEPLQVLSNEENIIELTSTNIFVDNTNRDVVISKANDMEIEEVALYNILGKQVGFWTITEQKPTYRLKLERKLPIAIYIVELKTNKGNLNKKVVIE